MIKQESTNIDNKIVSFLMIGQSNMAGRGNFEDVDPIVNKKCFVFRMGAWTMMTEPVNPDRDIFKKEFHSGIGLASSFADEVSKYFNMNVGLIPCANGGTKVSGWQPGEMLYDHAVMMAKLAMRVSEFGGIIWHQGESDCMEFDKNAYREQFLNTMTNIRKDLNAEKLPLIIGEISESITPGWNVGDNPKYMNELLHSLKSELPYCGIAKATDLELKSDGIHFTSASYRELGKRYFEKYIELIK